MVGQRSKGQAPAVLTNWWTQNQSNPPPLWNQLQNPQKQDVLVALMEEQQYVCVYCGKAITPNPKIAHIEHFWPQSEYPNLRFDWDNLFASCGPTGTKGAPKTCGDSKGNWKPVGHIDPTDPQCQKKFTYDGNGAIASSAIGGAPATTMIKQLSLDHGSLDYERFLIIAALEERIADGSIVAANKTAEIAIWHALEPDGKAIGWSHVAVRYLEEQQL